MADSVFLLRLVIHMTMQFKRLFKSPTVIKAKCTISTGGAPFIDSRNSKLLVFPFYESTDIEEIYFTFDDQAAGQIAEIELLCRHLVKSWQRFFAQ